MNEKVKGVHLEKRRDKYVSQIMVNGKRTHLGYFDNYEEAVAARKAGELKYGFVPITPTLTLKHRDDLTQERLRYLLHYDEETGEFTRKVKTAYKVKIGDIAGTISSDGYVRIIIDKKDYLAHRLAFLYMDGKFPEEGLEVDHINHVKNDNRWENLRIVTPKDNQKNRPMYKNNKVGQTGVYWHIGKERWIAEITINKETKHLGQFKTKEDAIAARKAAEIEYGFHKNHGTITN